MGVNVHEAGRHNAPFAADYARRGLDALGRRVAHVGDAIPGDLDSACVDLRSGRIGLNTFTA
jgi:hypothetical protein